MAWGINPTSSPFLGQVSILHDPPHRYKYMRSSDTKRMHRKKACSVHSFTVITYFIITNSNLAFFLVQRSYFVFYAFVILRARHSNTIAWYTYMDATLRWFAFKWHDSVCAGAGCSCRFLLLLGAHSLWILNRETVNRKRKKKSRNERANGPERNEEKRPNLHGMFISPFPSWKWNVNGWILAVKASAARRNEKKTILPERNRWMGEACESQAGEREISSSL